MIKTKQELIQQLNTTIYNNSNREITPTEHNSLVTNIIDSMEIEANNNNDTKPNDEFVIKKFILPIGSDINRIKNYINKYFQDYGRAINFSASNSSNYYRCIFTFTENNIIKYQGQSANYNDFISLITNNLTFSSNVLDFNVYIKISFNFTLAPISKFWNYNEGYAILKTYHSLYDKKKVFNNNLSPDFIQTLWSWLVNLESTMPNTNIDPKTLWLQGKQKSLYNGFHSKIYDNEGISFNNRSYKNHRTVRTTGSNHLVNDIIENNGQNKFSPRASFVTQINDLNYSNLTNYGVFPDNKYLTKDNLVRIHALRYKNLQNNNSYYSMIVKPIGIDTIIIGSSDVDKTTHKLFGIFYNNNTNPIIRELNTSEPHDEEQAAWKIKKSDIIKYMIPRNMQKSNRFINDNALKKCKLFYMDSEGNASTFSKAIVIKTRTNGANFKMMIEK